jgi:ATP-binding cassette subfamily B protein
LHPSEVIALVGENGAGKTTIVKLPTRLYDPDEGRILIEGIDLKAFDLVELRSHIGVIFQDFIRYDMTAHENIAVGQIDLLDDTSKVETAAERSLAAGIIANLPLGYDQPLGKRFSHGRNLSGGEWQKIALARAYMRDATCLILDEPTAAIDARAEAQVFERFKEICKGRSALLISHRFSTVRIADCILVLEAGRILEQGSHDKLLREAGRYAELFELQAKGYR